MEYSGEAIEALGVDERATMTNMAAEIGGFTGIVAPDEKVVEFLHERRGMDRNEARKLTTGLASDAGRTDPRSTSGVASSALAGRRRARERDLRPRGRGPALADLPANPDEPGRRRCTRQYSRRRADSDACQRRGRAAGRARGVRGRARDLADACVCLAICR